MGLCLKSEADMYFKRKEERNAFSAIGFAWELGYTIVIPLLLAAFLGRFADTYFHTKPVLFLVSIVFSVVITTILVYRKTATVLRSLEEKK